MIYEYPKSNQSMLRCLSLSVINGVRFSIKSIQILCAGVDFCAEHTRARHKRIKQHWGLQRQSRWGNRDSRFRTAWNAWRRNPKGARGLPSRHDTCPECPQRSLCRDQYSIHSKPTLYDDQLRHGEDAWTMADGGCLCRKWTWWRASLRRSTSWQCPYAHERIDRANSCRGRNWVSNCARSHGAPKFSNDPSIQGWKRPNGVRPQTLVIARNGILSPEFSSIEEWLGRNTESYYVILKETGEGAWNPQKSALPWVRFCLKAHYQQAATIIRRNEIMGRIWAEIETIRKTCGLHERVETTLMDATFGYKVTSARHKEAAEVSDIVATRELKRLADIGLLKAVGEKRGRFYLASEKLLEIFARCNIRPTKAPDPYTMLSNK